MPTGCENAWPVSISVKRQLRARFELRRLCYSLCRCLNPTYVSPMSSLCGAWVWLIQHLCQTWKEPSFDPEKLGSTWEQAWPRAWKRLEPGLGTAWSRPGNSLGLTCTTDIGASARRLSDRFEITSLPRQPCCNGPAPPQFSYDGRGLCPVGPAYLELRCRGHAQSSSPSSSISSSSTSSSCSLDVIWSRRIFRNSISSSFWSRSSCLVTTILLCSTDANKDWSISGLHPRSNTGPGPQ